MSNCKHSCCLVNATNPSVCQTLDELDFERGLWYAAQHGDLERVQKLLQRSGEADVRDLGGYTPLHYAARNGHRDVCEILLRHGADVNAGTKSGSATPLHRAASAGKYETVLYLLGEKADVKLKDADGKTALHRAAEAQNKNICSALLGVCSDLKKETDGKNRTAADYARSESLEDLLRV